MSRRIFAWLLLSSLALAVDSVLASGGRIRPSPQRRAREDEDEGPSDRTSIEGEVAEESGIRTAPVGPGSIRDEHDVQGLLTPVEGRHARIVARFPGPVRRVNVGVGDSVSAGQTLAMIESKHRFRLHRHVAARGDRARSQRHGRRSRGRYAAVRDRGSLQALGRSAPLRPDASTSRRDCRSRSVRLSDGARSTRAGPRPARHGDREPEHGRARDDRERRWAMAARRGSAGARHGLEHRPRSSFRSRRCRRCRSDVVFVREGEILTCGP